MIEVAKRTNPIRKPKGFEPEVQRWSIGLPTKQTVYSVGIFGIQCRDPHEVKRSGFPQWMEQALDRPDGPTTHDHATHVDIEGQYTHIVTAYWVDQTKLASWSAAEDIRRFWADPTKLNGPCGYFRELLTVPVDQQETIYWEDYRAALSKSDEVAFYPTPYCGYYGAMRDRIPAAGTEALAASVPRLLETPPRNTRGARWSVRVPNNLAVIRSATYWGNCDEEQLADFQTSLRSPLEKGMDYLRTNPLESGCCSLRYQQTVGGDGRQADEAHALGFFLSLSHLEQWAEGHAAHHAIFTAAVKRYKKYHSRNQLRTWHEVYILPAAGQTFDYINCSPRTGLLPWFEAAPLAAA